MTDKEKQEVDNLTDEESKEVDKLVDEAVASIWPKLQLTLKEMRNEFLRNAQEDRKERAKERGVELQKQYSDDWWEHIPDEEPRHGLTGLYIAPPVDSHVSICKNHPFVDPWMREEGVFALVLSVQPPPTIIACDNTGEVIKDKHGNPVRMPGIPLVEIAFPEEDYEGGLLLPADCLKVLEEDEDPESKHEEEDEEEYEDEEAGKYDKEIKETKEEQVDSPTSTLVKDVSFPTAASSRPSRSTGSSTLPRSTESPRVTGEAEILPGPSEEPQPLGEKSLDDTPEK